MVGAFDNKIHNRGFRFVPQGFSALDAIVDNVVTECVDVSDMPGRCDYFNLDPDDDIQNSSEENIDRLTNPIIDLKHTVKPSSEDEYYGLKSVTLDIRDYKIFKYNPVTQEGFAARNPDRLFIRAAATTEYTVDSSQNTWKLETGLAGRCNSRNRDCVARFAYTNPIFINIKKAVLGE